VNTPLATDTCCGVLHSVSLCTYSPWREMTLHSELSELPVKSSKKMTLSDETVIVAVTVDWAWVPRKSVTVSTTVNVPAFANVWEAVAVVAEPPSVKFQEYEYGVTPPVADPVNVTD